MNKELDEINKELEIINFEFKCLVSDTEKLVVAYHVIKSELMKRGIDLDGSRYKTDC